MYRAFVDLYRVFCQPTEFAAETKDLGAGGRARRLLQMAPAMLAAQMVLGGIVALLAQLFHLDPHWWPHGLRLALLGLLMGLGWATVWSVSFGASWGVTWAVSAWLLRGVVLPHFTWLQFDVDALGTWVPLALSSGVGLGLTLATPVGVLWGMFLWLGLGAVLGEDNRPGVMGLLLASFVVGYFRAEWYPLDVVGVLAQFSAARRHPRHARAFLRGSPVYWREPIWLTLPGLHSFLRIIGEHDFHAGLEECLFLISSRPSQAGAARRALMEIIALHLAHLRTIPEIAAAAEELGQASPPDTALPGPLEDAIPALEQLARHAGQHLTALLPHNRRRALEKLCEEADDLARRLALAPDRMSHQLVAVATQWRQVAEGVLADMGQAEAESGYVYNPYVFGQPIEETETNLFVGRRDTVREIEVSLLGAAQKPALVLWGPRRMGKTSVLLQLPRLLGPEFIPSFVDMQAAQVRESISAFFRSITAAAAAALTRRGLPTVGLTAAELEGSPFMAFAAWLEKVEAALTGERHLLLCFDEFERLEQSIKDGRLPRELLDEFRHLIQHHARIVLLFAGSHRPDELELNWPDALISTKMIRVSYLSEAEARTLITAPVPGFEISYQPESVERLLTVTRGQPYLVQAVCYELVNYLNLEGRREARPEDVEAAVTRALDSAHLYFAEMWRQFSEPEWALLSLLSHRPEGAPAEELAPAAGLALESALADLRRLEARHTLEQVGESGWRYQVPLVAAWVRNQGS